MQQPTNLFSPEPPCVFVFLGELFCLSATIILLGTCGGSLTEVGSEGETGFEKRRVVVVVPRYLQFHSESKAQGMKLWYPVHLSLE